jgi:hypothetical protein
VKSASDGAERGVKVLEDLLRLSVHVALAYNIP